MKLLIMSDTHGLTKEIKMIKERHVCDLVIHCGDSELTRDETILDGIYIVKGNCDYGDDFLDEEVIELNNNQTCFVTHGHLYGVKENLQRLIYRAEELAVKFCFFGHTHIAGVEKIGNIIFINPGSLRSPRNSNEKTYALLEIKEFKANLAFYNDEGSVVKEYDL